MQDSVYYTDFRWPELKAFAEKDAIIILPVGQTEEHGPHLPVGCDYHIAEETARSLAEKASQEFPVLVMPTIWCGYSGKGLFDWPGENSLYNELDATSRIILLNISIISQNQYFYGYFY